MRKICIILCMLILFTGCSSEKKNNEFDSNLKENTKKKSEEREDNKMVEETYSSIDELIAAMNCDPIVAEEMNEFVEFFIKEEIVSARENVDEDWEGDIAVIVTTKEGKEYGILSSATGYMYCITDRETGGLVYGATE